MGMRVGEGCSGRSGGVLAWSGSVMEWECDERGGVQWLGWGGAERQGVGGSDQNRCSD